MFLAVMHPPKQNKTKQNKNPTHKETTKKKQFECVTKKKKRNEKITKEWLTMIYAKNKNEICY